MFGFFKRKPSPPMSSTISIRDTLFGDLPLDAWPTSEPTPAEQEPWCSFVRAREVLAAGCKADAIVQWRRITEMVNLESRHYLQAWHFLRVHGVQPPPDKAKLLLGVILEVPMNGGLDLLAAYPERTARYYNHRGGGVVWEHPDGSLDGFIDPLLRNGERILQAIGPWDKPRPPLPSAGYLRINILAPSGLHFGQGIFDEMAANEMAKPVIEAGTALMLQLITRSGQPKA